MKNICKFVNSCLTISTMTCDLRGGHRSVSLPGAKVTKTYIVLRSEVGLAHLSPRCQKGKMLSSSWLRTF